MDICWSCRMLQAAGYARESWAAALGERQRNGRFRKTKSGNNNARIQEVLQVPQVNKSPDEAEIQINVVLQGQRARFPASTLSSSTTVSYPQITTGPSLVKRRLGSRYWENILEKIPVGKRDSAQCPVSYDSCAADLNGGCCPNDRVCGSNSCLAQTSTVGFACGRENYIACGIPEGGGCCPSSYICGTHGCTPPPGVAVTSTCSFGYYLCPAEVNYGCCSKGLGCAVDGCYTTEPLTITLTQTSKSTDANSLVHTITTKIISETVIGAPSTTVPVIRSIVPKESGIPAPIAKTSPTASTSPTSGLTKPELGGIIGGAISLLLVLIIAALLILRKLNKAIKATHAANSLRTPSEHRSKKFHQIQTFQQEIDAMSVDPLMMSASEASSSIRRSRRKKSTLHTTTHELASPSSPSAFHPFQTEATYRYDPAASESHFSDSTQRPRNASMDITLPLRQGSNNSYFDYPLRSSPRYSQVSPIPGQRPRQHARNWSEGSDLSAVNQNSDPVELDSEGRQSGLQWSLSKLRGSFSRRKSDSAVMLLGSSGRADWRVDKGLGYIAEAGESRVAMNEGEGITNAYLREISLRDRPVLYERTGALGGFGERR